MTALLPVRGRLLLCRTTVLTSLQHSTVATSTQQQLRTSQLCSRLQLPLRLLRLLQLILPQPTQLQQPQLRQIQLRPLQHQLHPLQRRPHLRLRPQQILLQLILRLLHPLQPILRPQPQLQLPRHLLILHLLHPRLQIQPQLSQP